MIRRHPASRMIPLIMLAAVLAGGTWACAQTTTTSGSDITGPRSVLPGLRYSALAEARRRVEARDSSVYPAYLELIKQANKALAGPLISVTHKKTLLPPTGDAHDYYSLSPYWWPDSSKSDGLPYIRRDGETNPESKRDLDQP